MAAILKKKKTILGDLVRAGGRNVMSAAQKVSDFTVGKETSDTFGSQIARTFGGKSAKENIPRPSFKERAQAVVRTGLAATPIGAIRTTAAKVAYPALARAASTAVRKITPEAELAERMWKFKGSKPGDVSRGVIDQILKKKKAKLTDPSKMSGITYK